MIFSNSMRCLDRPGQPSSFQSATFLGIALRGPHVKECQVYELSGDLWAISNLSYCSKLKLLGFLEALADEAIYCKRNADQDEPR